MTRGGLLRVRSRADAERVVRLADAELLEEDLGHLAVVVLPRVDEDVLELVAAPRRAPRRSARSSSCSAACRRPRGSCGASAIALQRIESGPGHGLRARYSQPRETGCFAGRKDAGRRRPGARAEPRLRPRRERGLGDLERHRALGRRVRIGLARRARDQEPEPRRADAPARARARRPRDDRRGPRRRRPGLAARLLERRAPSSTRAASPSCTSASGSPAPARAARTTPRSSPCPPNLVVPVPEGVSMRDASFAAIGAIALQGVRRAEPSLGERVVVVGLGLLGLITVQALRAAGCRVAGVEPVEQRRALAQELGAELALAPGEAAEAVAAWTDGAGADAVVITASAKGDELVNDAVRMLRRKGRVVPVGDVGLDFDREALYEREADVRISTSYGPGRYDPSYEEAGPRLPAAVRALDRGPQHGGVPAAASRTASSRSIRSSSSSFRSSARPRRTRRWRRRAAARGRAHLRGATADAAPVARTLRTGRAPRRRGPRRARRRRKLRARDARAEPAARERRARSRPSSAAAARRRRRSRARSTARGPAPTGARRSRRRTSTSSSSARATTRTPRSPPPRCAPARPSSSRSRSA